MQLQVHIIPISQIPSNCTISSPATDTAARKRFLQEPTSWFAVAVAVEVAVAIAVTPLVYPSGFCRCYYRPLETSWCMLLLMMNYLY
ncbi:hypothetical protein HanIR_Chr03g0127281 [Helianthus annuus]|nr:hypothetical protein HanIR_Chr03g0127281 [Helianthus annuus]